MSLSEKLGLAVVNPRIETSAGMLWLKANSMSSFPKPIAPKSPKSTVKPFPGWKAPELKVTMPGGIWDSSMPGTGLFVSPDKSLAKNSFPIIPVLEGGSPVRIDAHEAKAMGLVTQVYPDKETMEMKVNEWLQQHIIPKSAVGLKIATRVARKRFNARLKEDLKYYESVYLNELMKTHDGKEGLSSFLEKRKPVWKDE